MSRSVLAALPIEVDRKLPAVVPDIGGPGRGDRRTFAEEQPFVPMRHGRAGPSQLFLQLVGEAVGGEVGGGHASNLIHRLSFAGKGHCERNHMAKTSMSQRKTMGRVMHEYAHGELKSGPRGKGGKVRSRRQAIAIALKEAGASKYESKGENRRNLARTKAKEATGRTAQQETEGKAQVGARGKRESSRAMGGKNAKATTRRSPRRRTARRASR